MRPFSGARDDTEYSAFRGKRRDAFFTDEQLIQDFQATLDEVLLR